MKAELSKRSKWHIPKERYYELLHFCRQYPMWDDAAKHLDSLSRTPTDIWAKGLDTPDPTGKCVLARDYYLSKMKMVNKAAVSAAGPWYEVLKEGVIFGRCYEVLKARRPSMTITRDEYYDMYRQFFYLLSEMRG